MNRPQFGKPCSIPKMLESIAFFGHATSVGNVQPNVIEYAYDALVRDVYAAVVNPDELTHEVGSPPCPQKALAVGRRIVDHKLASMMWEDLDTAKKNGLIKDNVAHVIGLVEKAQEAGGISEGLGKTFIQHATRRDRRGAPRLGKPVSMPAMLGAIIAFAKTIDDAASTTAHIHQAYRDVSRHVFSAAKDPQALVGELAFYPPEDHDDTLMYAPAIKQLAKRVVDEKLMQLVWGGSRAYRQHTITRTNAGEMLDLVEDAFNADMVSKDVALKFIDYTQRDIIDGDFDLIGNTRTLSRPGLILAAVGITTATVGPLFMPPDAEGYYDLFTSTGGYIYLGGVALFMWTMLAGWLAERRAFKLEL